MQPEKKSQVDILIRDNPDISNVSGSDNLWQVTVTKIQNFITNQRLAIQKRRINHPLNLSTVLSLLPFIIGFAVFFKKKYPNELKSYFFEKNIPGLSIPSEKVNWDTVQYVLKPNLKGEKIETQNLEILCQENSLILNQNIFNKSLEHKVFSSTFQKSSGSSSFFNREFFTLTSQFDKYSPFQTLDELPFYLQSFVNSSDFSPNSSESKLLNIQNLNPWVSQNGSFSHHSAWGSQNGKVKEPKLEFSDKKISSFLGISRKNKKGRRSLVIKTLETNFQKIVDTNSFLTKQKEFQNLWELLQQEIHSLFLNKNLAFSSPAYFGKIGSTEKSMKNPKLLQKIKDFSVLEEKMLLEEILFGLAELELIDNPFQTRFMSGYRYPDMTSQEISQLFLQQKISSFSFWKEKGNNKSILLQIKVPSTLVESRSYDFSFQAIPEFSISTKPVLFKDFEKDKILYEGPGIILDRKSGFDWNTELENPAFKNKVFPNNRVVGVGKQLPVSLEKGTTQVFEMLSNSKNSNLRIWFQRYLSAYTPFANGIKNFFGIHDSPELLTSSSLTQADLSLSKIKTQEPRAANFPIFSDYKLQQYSSSQELPEVVINSNQSIFPVDNDLQLAFLGPEDWKKYYQLMKENRPTNSDTKFFTLPLIQTRSPKISSFFTQTNSQISLSPSLDYQFNTNLFNTRSSTSFSLPKNQKFQGLLENENFETSFDTGFYNKLPSIFSSLINSEVVFQDNWEPLSFQSWLIISQIGFAFSVFQILKALVENYGRELLVYLIDLVAMLGVVDEEIKQQIEVLLGNREKGFRIISNSRKKFSDIAGVKKLLPELAEIVWFLRNSAREFSLSKTLPRGILLVGPPGTGKTLLVQALAGEANVPVLALSGSSLVEPGESGALKLEILFQEARQLAPCIVFIDEMDTLAQKREQVMQHPMAEDGVLEALTNPSNSADTVTQFKNLQNVSSSLLKQANLPGAGETDPYSVSSPTSKLETQVNIQAQAQQQMQKEQLRLLLQLLVELDGIQGRDGVIVIGATNRPETLDAAVWRPGRFDKILELGLPGYQKRIDILKLYSQKLGYNQSISWNYFAERTDGFTAADLASIMNVSSLKAILSNTAHTLESIEHGIDRIMTSESQKISNSFLNQPGSTTIKSLLSSSQKPVLPNTFGKTETKQVVLKSEISENERLAYYQAGKIICTSLLPSHPRVLIAQLWNRRTNLRALKIAANLQNYFLRFARRREIEERIIGSYAGKVGEILYLQKLSSQNYGIEAELFNVNNSTLGLDDLSFAQVFVNFLIQKWYLYSTQPLLQRLTELAENRNFQELSEEKIAFLDLICQNFESSPRPVGQFLPEPFEDSEDEEKTSSESELILTQHTFSIPWWQQQISYQLQSVKRSVEFRAWYRIYIPNPEETELNPYWLPPDEFYHRNKIHEAVNSSTQSVPKQSSLETLSSWNELGLNSQDYKTHSLVLQSFNKAFVLVEEYRELLDAIAAKLLTQKVLRQWEISELFEKYNLEYNSPVNSLGTKGEIISSDEIQSTSTSLEFAFSKILPTTKLCVTSDWGPTSRRKTSKWIDFQSLKP